MRVSIDRFVARFLCRLSLVLLLIALIAAQSDPARADDNADAANTAVQLFVTAGQAAGLPITQQEAALVTQIVSCGVANQSNVGDCAKNAAVAVVLQQAGVNDPTITNAVTCLVSTANPVTCAAQAAASVAKLPPDAQPAVNCMLTGGNVVDCGKKLAEGMVLDKVPADIQAPAKCVMDGGDAKKCATDFITQQVVSHLPANMQGQATQVVGCLGQPDVAGCITSAVASGVAGPQVGALVTCATQPNANLGQCAATFASNNMPTLPAVNGVDPNAAAKAIVACVGAPDFAACAKDPAITGARNVATQVLTPAAQEAINAAIHTINALKPDAAMTIDAGVNSEKDNVATLQNIVKVADGIKNKDWGEVTMAAGPELAIVASNIILSVFLTPAVADALGPAVAAMIHNDAAAAQLALQAIAKGDPVALAQVVFTWYETQFIDKPCALLGDNDVKKTVCGGLSDAIKTISDAGGDLAKKLLGMGKDVLQWLGVWGTVDSVATTAWNTVKGAIDDIGHFLGLGGDDQWKPPADCANFSPKDYLANNYLACVTNATNATVAGSLASGLGAMRGACIAALDRCIDPKNRGKSNEGATCDAMGRSLSDLANQVSAAMGTAADLYTNSVGTAAFVSDAFQKAKDNGLAFGPAQSASPDFCSPDFWNSRMQSDYAAKCASFVNQQFPGMKANARPNTCSSLQTPNSRATSACLISLNANLDGSAAAGKSLTGPNSVFCKAQQQLIKDNPCKLTYQTVIINGTPIQLPSGLKCNHFEKLPFSTIDFPLRKPDGTLKRMPWDDRPGALRLPKGGQGSSGYNTVNSRTNTGDEPLKKIPGRRQRPFIGVTDVPPSPGPGGGGSNSAMDRLGGGMGGLDAISGNKVFTGPGGLQVNAPRRAGSSGGSSGYNTSRQIPSAPKPAASSSSGGSSGYNTSRPIPSAPRAPAPDDRLDYGGCAGCGRDQDLHVR